MNTTLKDKEGVGMVEMNLSICVLNHGASVFIGGRKKAWKRKIKAVVP